MRKGKRARATAPAVRSARGLTLKLEPDTHLRVTMVTPEKLESPLGVGILSLIAGTVIFTALFLFLYAYFVLQTEFSSPIEFKGVSVSLRHSTYVAFGDEAEIDLSVTNSGTQPFSGEVTVVFKGDVGAQPLPSQSTTFKVENLVSGASGSHRLKFALAGKWRRFSEQPVGTAVQVSSAAVPAQALPGPEIRITPIPFLRTIISLMSNSAIIAALAALLWEVARKRVFGWEAT